MKIIVTYNISDSELNTLDAEMLEHLIQYGYLQTDVHGSCETSPFWDEKEKTANNPILEYPETIEIID